MQDPESQTVDVLVLGGGFAGTRCALRLERRLPRDATIVLVNSENYVVFQPLLPEVVGGSLDPSHVISPLRHLLRRTQIVRGEVRSVQFAAPGQGFAASVTVDVDGSHEVVLRCRQLVIALGSSVDVSRTPGMAEQALLMRNVADALTLRYAVITRLEHAALEPDDAERRALLTFVVVGGGFSGVETAAEVHDLVHGAMRFFPNLRDAPKSVICIHSRDHILPELDPRLGAYAQQRLSRRGVVFRLNERVRAASREGVYLANGELLPTRTIVCTVGNAPHALLQSLPGGASGRLPADEFLRLQGRTDVWVLGDCASVPDGHGGTSPPTAQFATRQGEVAARNIAATLRGTALQRFAHKSQGQLATLGHLDAVAAIGRVRFSGLLAWWMWRTIYLSKLPRLDRKLRVVIDWTLNLFFPRDLTAVDVEQMPGRGRFHLEAGETLFRQGDPSAAFYIVESGKIELTRRDGEQVLGCDVLGPGEHFGEGSLLRHIARSTTAVAIEPTTVLTFPARLFTTLTKHFAGLRRLLEATSRRFQPVREILPAWVPAASLQKRAREVMSAPVFTMRETATLAECLTEFLARKFNCFPLTDDAGRLTSIITSTDLFAALRADVDLQQPLRVTATKRVQCLGPDDPVERAVEIMRRRDVKHAVVVDGDQRVVGLVSMKDVLSLILARAPGPEPARE
jgi:NADH dehydrogenase